MPQLAAVLALPFAALLFELRGLLLDVLTTILLRLSRNRIPIVVLVFGILTDRTVNLGSRENADTFDAFKHKHLFRLGVEDMEVLCLGIEIVIFHFFCFDLNCSARPSISESNLREENSMRSETHTEPEEIVDDDVPVDAFLDTIGTHVPVSTLPEPPEDEEKEEKGKE
jgi:hypothetical protein